MHGKSRFASWEMVEEWSMNDVALEFGGDYWGNEDDAVSG
jgi:hypothetical protein